MNADTEARVMVLEKILCAGGDTAACRAHAEREWGLSDRQCRRLVVVARERIRANWDVERPQMIAELLSQLSTLQIAARKAGQYHVALGAINTAAKLCQLF
jgi:hypothetical protein